MRARHPDREGFVERDGVRLGYEVFGDGDPAVLLLPTWTIVHSRFWKMQIPFLARHYRVVTFDGPGNGRSDRPLDPEPYSMDSLASDAIAVLGTTESDRAVVVSLSQAALWSLRLAADHPELVMGQVFISPTLPLTPQAPDRAGIVETFGQKIDDPQGWEKYNAHYWRTDYEDFAEFFFSRCLTEPHSTKQREDAAGWALETTPEILLTEARAKYGVADRDSILELCERVTAPTLVIHGANDQISPLSRGQALADATGGRFVIVDGGGHFSMARDPVLVNLHIKAFVDHIVSRMAA